MRQGRLLAFHPHARYSSYSPQSRHTPFRPVVNQTPACVMVFAIAALGCHRTEAPRPVEPPDFPLLAAVGGDCPGGPCERCDLREYALARGGPDAADCGWAHRESERAAMVACALEHDAAAKPFVAIESLPGIDSFIVLAFARGPSRELEQLWYDSDRSGRNCACSANISLRVCNSPVATDKHGDVLVCRKPDDWERLCNERGRRAME
jgi:hypothetical protein